MAHIIKKVEKKIEVINDANLNWISHIFVMSKRLSSSAYALFKLAPDLNPDALVRVVLES